jgi:hypothetical protein
VPEWAELLDRLDAAFAWHGVRRASALPLRWRRETDLTVSAVQAVDPYLKHRQPFTYRSGYLPQPVVRFTGPRDHGGQLREGYLTSFVNVSRLEPVHGAKGYAEVFDDWIGVLSRLGLHARHVDLSGDLRVWRRTPVEGVTLRYRHAGLDLGDIVFLWNVDDPSYAVTDLGTGVERLRWVMSRMDWHDVVFGSLAKSLPTDQLDALRTAVLLVGSGIRPAARGAGHATRRILRTLAGRPMTLALSAAVRRAHRFWGLTATDLLPWPEITLAIENEVYAR